VIDLGFPLPVKLARGGIFILTSQALPIIIKELFRKMFIFHMKKKTFLKWAILLPILLFLLGCAGKGKDIKKIEGDPETLYKQGLTRFNKRDYSEALKKFEQLKSSFPDSPPHTVWAELKIGDCHFFKKDYVEAIAAYEEFKKIHPTHEEMPYVQYQIGMAYFNQMRTLDRDQTSTKKALSNFEYLIANYSQSLFTEKAKEKVVVCKKWLADHEFYIGNYYYKNRKFKAASLRFQGLTEKFPKMPGEDRTLFLLGKSYLELDQGEKAKEAFTQIVTEYPKSSHYKEAKAILDQGVKEKKVSLRKTQAKEARKKGETTEIEPDRVVLVKFEEEGKQSVSLTAPLPFTREPVKPIPPTPEEETEEITPPLAKDQMQEDRTPSIPQDINREKKDDEDMKVSPIPGEEPQKVIPPKTEPRIEVKPEEEKRIAALPSTPTTPKEVEKSKKGVLPEPGQAKLVDTGQPIDITSDRVETYSKENLIVFKGNVMARQKDIVIYADSLEAVIIQDGKGIEKVIAGGNVKIQQGLRVASCQRAVFYNLDQKVFLTGDPKVWEGDNIVSGDEIIFDIEQNRIEVKGGPGGRGKAKIHPGGEFEKPK
jgi:outer membrane protein assembly factor BamD